MKAWANGIGGSLGDVLATTKPLFLSGDVWFVNSVGGVDAASPAGKDRQKPLATLSQAITNAAAADIVVLMDGHTETLTAALTVSKALCIVGEGLSSGVPTAQLKINASNQSLLTLNVAGTQIRNIKFPASVQSNVGAGGNLGKVAIAAAVQVIGCYFEQSGLDQLPAMSIGNAIGNIRISNTTVISTATAVATRPTYGLYHIGTTSDLDMDGVVFSDGTVGFSTAAWDGTAGAATRMRVQGLSLLLGADVRHHASTTGWIAPPTTTGGAGVSW